VESRIDGFATGDTRDRSRRSTAHRQLVRHDRMQDILRRCMRWFGLALATLKTLNEKSPRGMVVS